MNLELITRRALINLSDKSVELRAKYYNNKIPTHTYKEQLDRIVFAQNNLSWYLSVLEKARVNSAI